MEIIDYFKLICEAHFSNEIIESVLIKKQREMSRKGVGYIEFFENCEAVIHKLREMLNKQIENEKQILLLELKYLTPDISLIELESKVNKIKDFILKVNDRGIFIPKKLFTNISQSSNLYINEIDNINDQVIYAKDKVMRENFDEITSSKKNLHNDIFKNNAFKVFDEFMKREEIDINKRIRLKTNLSVIFYYLKDDNLISDNVQLANYKNWLRTIYFKDASDLDKDSLKYIQKQQKKFPQRFDLYKQLKDIILKS